jgi:hypothetical protein
MRKDMEGSGRGLISTNVVAFAWRDWEKSRKLRIAAIQADI